MTPEEDVCQCCEGEGWVPDAEFAGEHDAGAIRISKVACSCPAGIAWGAERAMLAAKRDDNPRVQ